ncbi:cyclase family protein [Gordonia sp. TBRC 11910]|uniref:Cyclase family protein n=1 Tax=Gordonia asplenii TaxID=2725283 RepID=A0A848KXB1_9ACTN|nr:cyclase family protein [Gordonia asplenii]NMO03280.1 cyclase family protein [Gordonia asplenii]
MDSQVPSERLRTLESRCSNAGRWGAHDDLGTLNLITPAVRIRAASLVSEGISVSLASNLQLPATQYSDLLVSHSIDSEPAVPDAIVDKVILNVHGWGTHIDALGHFHLNGTTYNNRKVDDILAPQGLTRNAVTAMRDGIFTRGVLLDVARARGVSWLAPDEYVTAADLDRAEAATGLTVESGDAVIVHVGLDARLAANTDADPNVRAGLDISAVLWLSERDVAIFGGDCIERLPSADPDLALPLHQLGLARMGLTFLEWLRLDDVLRTVERLDRSAFLLTAAPLALTCGTGSPLNPIATF